MTTEQKNKLEQAAETAWEQDARINPTPVNPHAYIYGFKAGAKAVLDNPSDFNLMCKTESAEHLRDTDSDWEDALVELKGQNEKYHIALERIATADVILLGEFARKVAKETLKQGVNNDM